LDWRDETNFAVLESENIMVNGFSHLPFYVKADADFYGVVKHS